jgi:hypothetical protein
MSNIRGIQRENKGYEKDMNAMLSVNQGLRSRFSAKLLFEDFSVELVIELLTIRLAEYELRVATSVIEELPSICQQITEMPFFANGRDIDTIAKSAFRNCAVRVGCKGEPVIEVSDIRLAIEALLSTKVMLDAPTAGPSTAVPLHASQQQNAFNHAIPQTSPAIDIATDMTVATGIKHVEEEEVRGEEKEEEEKKEEENRTREYPAPKVTEFTIKLQYLLDQMGLNNQEGVRILSELPLDSDCITGIAEQLSKMLCVSIESAISLLGDWQHMQADVKDLLEAQEESEGKKKKSMIPIWRCSVCGQADKPYIACWVAPYIVRYESRIEQ